MMKRILIGLLMIVGMQSCAEKMTSDTVINSKWLLSEWPGQTLPIGKEATLSFDAENKITGKSFCNGYGGNAIIKGNSVKFDGIFGTMMYCEEVGQAEKNYLDDLKATTSFKVVNGKLQLFRDAQLVMVFVKNQ